MNVLQNPSQLSLRLRVAGVIIALIFGALAVFWFSFGIFPTFGNSFDKVPPIDPRAPKEILAFDVYRGRIYEDGQLLVVNSSEPQFTVVFGNIASIDGDWRGTETKIEVEGKPVLIGKPDKGNALPGNYLVKEGRTNLQATPSATFTMANNFQRHVVTKATAVMNVEYPKAIGREFKIDKEVVKRDFKVCVADAAVLASIEVNRKYLVQKSYKENIVFMWVMLGLCLIPVALGVWCYRKGAAMNAKSIRRKR